MGTYIPAHSRIGVTKLINNYSINEIEFDSRSLNLIKSSLRNEF